MNKREKEIAKAQLSSEEKTLKELQQVFKKARQDVQEKISELNDLLSKLEGLSGTLHLEEYDSTKDSIIFTKDS